MMKGIQFGTLLLAWAIVAAFAAGCGREEAVGEGASAQAASAGTIVTAGSTLVDSSPDAGRRSASSAPAGDVVFTDAVAQAKAFIALYRSIQLTPEQERIKIQALSAIPAPCCAQFSLATCCCPCNLAKASWGLAAWLITEKGYGVEEVRDTAVAWVEFVNPGGFTGDACFTGGCNRSFAHNGCGGMDESRIL